MVTYNIETNDSIWKAISDSKRRVILDTLSSRPHTTGQLVELFPTIGRTAVLKHIGILEGAELIRVKREGRVRWNYINIAPLQAVCSGWLLKHVEGIASSAERLKTLSEIG